MQDKKDKEFEEEKNDEEYFENLSGDDDEDSEVTGGAVEEGERETEEDLDETSGK